MPDAKQPQQSEPAEPRAQVKTQSAVDIEARKVALLAKVRLMHDKNLRGGELTGQNPAKTYMWVNSRDDRQAFFKAWGWELCVDPAVQSSFRTKDLTHRRADVVLYEIDKDLYEAQEAFKQLRGLEGIEGHKNAAIASFNRQGVREYIPHV